MRDGDENHRAERGRRQRVQKTASEESELYENPAADVGTDQTKHDIRDATEAPAARDLSRQPSRDQAKKQPRDEAVRPEPNPNRLLRKNVCNEHASS